MAISFDEINDYYSVLDAAELALQDGDWCVGIWTNHSDNAGIYYHYLISNNALGANDSLNLYLGEAGNGSIPDQWAFRVVDGDGTNLSATSASSPGADSTWRLIIVQRRTADNEIQLWFCEKGGVASKEGSVADTSFDAVDGGAWNIGRRTDGDADRYFGGTVCEFFKGDFALSQAQIEALAAGLPILSLAAQAGLTLDVYWPMWEADATLLDYSDNGNDGTRQDTPATATHAPVCTPIKRRRV